MRLFSLPAKTVDMRPEPGIMIGMSEVRLAPRRGFGPALYVRIDTFLSAETGEASFDLSFRPEGNWTTFVRVSNSAIAQFLNSIFDPDGHFCQRCGFGTIEVRWGTVGLTIRLEHVWRPFINGQKQIITTIAEYEAERQFRKLRRRWNELSAS